MARHRLSDPTRSELLPALRRLDAVVDGADLDQAERQRLGALSRSVDEVLEARR